MKESQKQAGSTGAEQQGLLDGLLCWELFMVPGKQEDEQLWWATEARCSPQWLEDAVGSGCSCQTPFGSQYCRAVAVRNTPPTSPPQFGTLWSFWSVVIPAARSHGKAGTFLAPDAASSGWLFPEVAVSARFAGWLWGGRATCRCC